jgi:uncharacterized protein
MFHPIARVLDSRNIIEARPVTTLAHLRRFAVARSLFPPATLDRAFEILGFVQADPIRAPARAQDLTLRHRVQQYRAGDLERRYAELMIEEDVFINYGFVTRALHGLMHPRIEAARWNRPQRKRVDAILEFVRSRGAVHPREVDAHFAHGTVTNYWGGVSKATTHLLDAMHYFGLLRVVRREAGTRVYGLQELRSAQRKRDDIAERVDALVDVVVRKYAPLPSRSLSMVIARLRYAAPQLQGELKAASTRARQRLARARVGGLDWFWPADETPRDSVQHDNAFLLAPFDPIVWDRSRFELFWGWAYRFEAYTPARKRVRGYYALPLLWRDRMIGWGNVTVENGRLQGDFGYVSGAPARDRRFRQALEEELDRVRRFLGLGDGNSRSENDVARRAAAIQTRL